MCGLKEAWSQTQHQSFCNMHARTCERKGELMGCKRVADGLQMGCRWADDGRRMGCRFINCMPAVRLPAVGNIEIDGSCVCDVHELLPFHVVRAFSLFVLLVSFLCVVRHAAPLTPII